MKDDHKDLKLPSRGKYLKLHDHLRSLDIQEWRTSFREIESIIGTALPKSARKYSAWWANEEGVSRHTQSLAWTSAGWKTSGVDMQAEKVVFRREQMQPSKTPLLDAIWPPRSVGEWPEGLSLRREDMYEDRA